MLDTKEIKKILPHRDPFLLVDRVIDMDVDKMTITAFRNIHESEPVFRGHFPGNPIYPGVMIIEGLAQTGGILGLKKLPKKERKKKLIYFLGIDNAKFRSPVALGDQLRYEIKIKKMSGKMMNFEGFAYVNSTLVCQAEMKAMIIDKK